MPVYRVRSSFCHVSCFLRDALNLRARFNSALSLSLVLCCVAVATAALCCTRCSDLTCLRPSPSDFVDRVETRGFMLKLCRAYRVSSISCVCVCVCVSAPDHLDCTEWHLAEDWLAFFRIGGAFFRWKSSRAAPRSVTASIASLSLEFAVIEERERVSARPSHRISSLNPVSIRSRVDWKTARLHDDYAGSL